MTLLLRDSDAKTGEQAPGTPPEAAPEIRACPQCQAPLEAGQDWCLSCGEAQPGRLAALPGKRAAATVFALTAVLVGGAVAASYAALQKDPAKPAPTQLAQVPAPTTATPAPAPTDQPPSTAAPAVPSTPPPASGTTPPSTGSPPATPAPSTPPSTPATGTTGTGSTPTGKGSTGTGSSGAKAGTRTTTTPADATPTAIKLDATAAALYDPYTRNTASGDVAKALDGDPGTSFPITVADGATQIGAGLVVDLGKVRGLRQLDLTTKTPGFKVEIYATDSDVLPPDVLDTRWAHIKDVKTVGTGAAGGKEIVALGSGTTKYRHVLLWFTTPPTDGLTVRVSELKLFG
jgi:hypothetical protein